MTAPPAFTTLPPNPSQTITNVPGGAQSAGQSGASTGVSGSRAHSSPTSRTSTSAGGNNGGTGGNSSGKSSTTAIILGTVLGVLGLSCCTAFTVWYFHRRRSGPAFSPLDDDDEEHPHSITAVSIVGAHGKGPRILALPLGLLSIVGLGRQRHADRSRHDILADEDRSFDWEILRHEGSGHASGSGEVSARNSPYGWSNAVTTSLRNLARSTGRGSHSRESTTAGDWEKRGRDPFSPEVALMAGGLERDQLPEQPGPSHHLYTDPFANPDTPAEVLYDYLSGRTPEPQEDTQEERPTALEITVPPRVDFVPLSPLLEQASQNSLSHSSSSHNTSSDHVGSSSSLSGPPRSPRPSSILDLNPPPSEPIRRSNSWWSRFAKTPLLERRSSDASSRNPGGFIDFRDPNPPPRLLTIEESTHTHSPDVSESRRAGSIGISAAQAYMNRKRPTLYREMSHGRSASSLQTANTDTLERVGGTMDIVQRDATLDSQFTNVTNPFADDEFGIAAGTGRSASASSSLSPGPLRALYVRGEASYSSTRTEESSSDLLLPPPPPPPPLSPSPAPATPSSAPVTPSPPTPATPELPDLPSYESATAIVRPRDSPHSPGVSERVRAFERRMSRESELPPPLTNTRRREERSTPPRPVVRYGLVPRPSLFVANPDGGGGGGNGGPEREPRV